ncbi:hypothetical protein FA15DRAFT_710037 [Coprinopsis marcescibilis]|uniref:Uncharacterized protein n=1 Tax=Coprinopsis marcescibilis TaxID=230819 RepID=A0A5C3KE11_COPMA|nr:hypothetical protein FA15DRAFT_710037 [Coprinopsis marcescibilis]
MATLGYAIALVSTCLHFAFETGSFNFNAIEVASNWASMTLLQEKTIALKVELKNFADKFPLDHLWLEYHVLHTLFLCGCRELIHPLPVDPYQILQDPVSNLNAAVVHTGPRVRQCQALDRMHRNTGGSSKVLGHMIGPVGTSVNLDGVPAPTEGGLAILMFSEERIDEDGPSTSGQGHAHVHYYLDVQVEEIDDDHDTAAESFKRKESSTSRFHDSDNCPMKKNKGYHGNDSNTNSDANDTDNVPDYKGKGKEKAHCDQSRSQKHRYKRQKHENLYHDINLYGHHDSHYED